MLRAKPFEAKLSLLEVGSPLFVLKKGPCRFGLLVNRRLVESSWTCWALVNCGYEEQGRSASEEDGGGQG